MGVMLNAVHSGENTRHLISVYDETGAAVDLSSGVVTIVYKDSAGNSVSKSAILDTPSTAPQAYFDVTTTSFPTLTGAAGGSGIVSATVTAVTNAAVEPVKTYIEEFAQPMLVAAGDGEWVYGLVTLAEMREYLGLTTNASDHKLVRVIRAASAEIRGLCGRDRTNGFKSQSWTEVFDGELSDVLTLREWPVTSITSIAVQPTPVDTAVTLDSDTYRLDADGIVRLLDSAALRWDVGAYIGPAFMRSSPTFGDGRLSVTVVYVGGFTSAPHDLRQLCLELAATRYAGIGGRDMTMQSETLDKYSYTRRSIAEERDWLRERLGDYMRIAV